MFTAKIAAGLRGRVAEIGEEKGRESSKWRLETPAQRARGVNHGHKLPATTGLLTTNDAGQSHEIRLQTPHLRLLIFRTDGQSFISRECYSTVAVEDFAGTGSV